MRALLVAAGAIPGAQVGAHISRRLHGPLVARLLVLALLVVGGRLLLSGAIG